jgi:hypothetical protein
LNNDFFAAVHWHNSEVPLNVHIGRFRLQSGLWQAMRRTSEIS